MFKIRALTALVLLVGFSTALFFAPPLLWKVLIAAAIWGGGMEWASMSGLRRPFQWVFGAVLGVSTFAASGLDLSSLTHTILLASALFWLVVAPVWLRRHWHLTGSAALLLGALLLIPAGMAMVQLREWSAGLLLGLMSLVWLADSAAYFVGRACGRHKLALYVSPGKSWEGVLGGVVAVVLAGAWLNTKLPEVGVAPLAGEVLVPALLVFAALSVVGDLFESLAKRQAGVKDSGTVLPGHGGILDRIDSLTSTLPIGLLFLQAMRS